MWLSAIMSNIFSVPLGPIQAQSFGKDYTQVYRHKQQVRSWPFPDRQRKSSFHGSNEEGSSPCREAGCLRLIVIEYQINVCKIFVFLFKHFVT